MVVNPTGPANINLLVTVPQSLADAGTLTYAYKDSSAGGFNAASIHLTPGVTARVPVTASGVHWLEIVYRDELLLYAPIDVTPGHDATIALGAIKVSAASIPRPNFGVDGFNVHENLQSISNGTRFDVWTELNGDADAFQLVGRGVALPALPGEYVLNYTDPHVPLRPFTVAAGEVTLVDASLPNEFGSVRFDRQAAAFPNHGAPSVTLLCRHKGSSGSFQSINESGLPPLITFFSATDSECQYQTNGASSATFTVPHLWLIAARVARLDVNDVALDDGSGALVHGTFTVTQNNPPAGFAPEPYTAPTKTGLDLPPGSYHLVTSYLESGATKSIAQDITL